MLEVEKKLAEKLKKDRQKYCRDECTAQFDYADACHGACPLDEGGEDDE